jgi:hypothetical protein
MTITDNTKLEPGTVVEINNSQFKVGTTAEVVEDWGNQVCLKLENDDIISINRTNIIIIK